MLFLNKPSVITITVDDDDSCSYANTSCLKGETLDSRVGGRMEGYGLSQGPGEGEVFKSLCSQPGRDRAECVIGPLASPPQTASVLFCPDPSR